MKRFPVILLLAAIAAGGLGLLGCGDDKDPMYWVDKMYDRPEREQALKRLSEMFSTLRQNNNQDNNAPPVRELAAKIAQPLGEAFKAFKRDRINRLEIIKLLATLNEPKVNNYFLEGLDVDVTKEQAIFIVCAQTLAGTFVQQASAFSQMSRVVSPRRSVAAPRLRRSGSV